MQKSIPFHNYSNENQIDNFFPKGKMYIKKGCQGSLKNLYYYKLRNQMIAYAFVGIKVSFVTRAREGWIGISKISRVGTYS
jgi:hypothetical protein